MGLSQRVTEILENIFDITFNAMTIKPISTTLKSATNIVTVDTTENGTTIVSANSSRVSLFIQNQSSQPVLITFSENVSTTNYSMILTPASDVRIGDGGTFATQTWKGSIKGLVEANTSDVSIFEEVIS